MVLKMTEHWEYLERLNVLLISSFLMVYLYRTHMVCIHLAHLLDGTMDYQNIGRYGLYIYILVHCVWGVYVWCS